MRTALTSIDGSRSAAAGWIMTSMGARVFDLIATAVRVVCAVIAALIAIHAAFVLFEANPNNALVEFTESVRSSFGWFTRDLFTKPNPKIAEVINDALAAIVWVVVGSLVSKLIVRFAPTSKAKTS